jgi:hypothetical protein
MVRMLEYEGVLGPRFFAHLTVDDQPELWPRLDKDLTNALRDAGSKGAGVRHRSLKIFDPSQR